MITAKERTQILLAEWLQKQAEDDHLAKMSKRVTRRSMELRREIYADECDRSEADD